MTRKRTAKQRLLLNKKLKEKSTHKIIVLGSGGVGKVSLNDFSLKKKSFHRFTGRQSVSNEK